MTNTEVLFTNQRLGIQNGEILFIIRRHGKENTEIFFTKNLHLTVNGGNFSAMPENTPHPLPEVFPEDAVFTALANPGRRHLLRRMAAAVSPRENAATATAGSAI